MSKADYTQWSPREIVVKESPEQEYGRSGLDLEDVIRDMIQLTLGERGWTQEDLAAKMGVPQSRISRFLTGESGKIEILTRLCIALDSNPVALLCDHPKYDPESRAGMTYPKDHLYRDFNAILSNAFAHALIAQLGKAQGLGVLGECLEAIEHTVVTAEKAGAAQARSARSKPATRGRKPLIRKKRKK